MRFLPRLALLCGALLFLFGASARPAAAQSGAIGIRGDVTADGNLTASDALAVLSHVVGKPLPAGYSAELDGDADGNGQVTALDALVILARVVGKDVARYPVGRRLLSGTVGAAGGAVVSRADSIRVEFPDGALAEAVYVTVEPAAVPAAPGLLPGSALAVGPDGQRFVKPVRLVLRYDPGAVPGGAAAEELRIHRRAGDAWEEVPGGTVDVRAGVASAMLAGGGTYAILPRAATGLTLVKAAGDNQTGTVGQPPADFLVAQLVNAAGRGVANRVLTWTVIQGGGTIRPLEERTDSAGRVRAVFTLGPDAGLNRVSVRAAGADSVVFTATGVSAAPSSIVVVAGDGQTAVAGSAVATPPSVRVTDARGNPVVDATVTFAVATGGGTVTGATPKTDGNGIATVGSWTLGTTAGPNSLTATLEGGLSATVNATGIPGAAATISIQSGDGGTAVVATTRALEARVVDANGNGVAGVTVSWAVATGGGSLSAPSSATDGSGVASVVWTFGGTVGTQSVTATAAGLTGSPLTFSAATTPAAASQLAIATQPSAAAQSGIALPQQPVVQLRDAFGNAVAQSGVAVTAALASGTGTLGGTATVNTDAAGAATFTDLAVGGPVGAYTLGFSATGLTGATSGTINLAAGAPASMAVNAGDAQTAVAGSAVATAPSVRVTDGSGNPVSGVSVTFAVATGGGSVTGATQTTDAGGIATVGSWTLGTTAGANTLTATAGSLSATFSATGTAGAAANIAKTAGDGQSAAVGSAVPTAPSVTITDQYGNPVAGVAVTFAASGNGSVAGSPATTDASGVATVGSWTLATTVGGNTLTATAGALSTSFSATGTVGAAANLAKTAGDAQTATVGSAVATAPSVTITDQYGNPVPGISVTFAASGNGSVTGSPATTDASGVATVGSWTLATAVGANTLTATAGALSTSFSATGTVGAAANLAKTAGDGQTATAGSAVATAPSVTITDQYGNPVAGVSVTFAASGNGSVTGSPATTDASGVATVGSWTLATTVGGNTLTATAGALSTSFGATGTAGAAASITRTAGDGQTAAVGTAVATAPAVTITDQYGNPVAGVSVTFAASGNGSVTGSPATTDASGVATVGSWTLATAVGGNTLTATAGALSTSFSATGTVGAAANITRTAGDGQTATAGSAVATAPSVTITDQYGNPVAGVSVTFAASGNGSVTGSPATTDASGVATVGSWTLATAAGANTLTATAGALSTTFSATGTVGAAANIARTAGDGQSAAVGTAVATAPSVTITDQYGNPVAGVSVTFAASGNGSVSGSPATTDASGVATAGSWTLATTAGANTLTATAGALSTTFSASGTVGAAANLTKTAGDGQTATVGSAVATAPSVTVTDQYGNPVAGVSVTFAASGNGSVTGSPATTDASGVATVGSWTLATTAGANTLTASAGALSTSFTATGTVGAAANIARTAGDGQTAGVGTAVATAPSVTITDQYGNPVAGVSVTFAASGNGSVTGSPATTDASGVATAGSWTLATTAGANTLTATAGALSTTFTATGTVGAAANIAKTAGDGQTAGVGAAVATAPSVTITDQYGNPVAGVSVTFAASGNGSVTGSPATTDASGVATVGSWTLGTTVGANTLTATAGALSTTFSATATVGAAANIAKTAGDGQTASVGTAVATAPSVTITDQYGNPVPGVSVTFAASGNGSVTGSPATTDASGVATVGSWTLATTAGANTLTVTAGALSTTFSATGTGGAAANIAKTAGDAQTATVGSAVATAPSVTITDQYGNPVAGVSVTFAVASGGGSVTGATQTTDATGVATVGSWTLGTTAGANTLTATASSLSATFTATGTAAAAAQLGITTQPSDSVQSGVAFPRQPVVQLRDQYGNAVAQAGVSVAAAIASGGGTLGGTLTATTDAGGVATFTDLTITGTVGDRTLSFSAAGLTAATSDPVHVRAGAASQLTITTEPSDSVQGGTAFPRQPTVQLRDASGNPVSQAGVTVTAAIASGGGTLGGTTTATTDAGGAATFTDLSITGTAGARTLSFSATGLTPATSAVVYVKSGPPAQLAITTQPSATAQAGVAFAQQPAVQLQDASGNPVGQAGVTVTAEVLAGSGTLGGTLTATTDASGVATFTNLFIGGTAGGYTLRFTAPPLTSVNSIPLALSAGTPASLAFSVQPSTTVASAAISPAVRVSVVDAYGNVNPNASDNVTVAIGTNPSGGTLSGTTTVAATGGVATFSDLSINLVGAGYDLTANSGSLAGATSAPFSVTHGPLDHFLVEAAGGGPIGSQLAGTPFNVRVTAQDAYNNTVTSFTGTTGFTSTPTGGISGGHTSAAFTAGVLSSHAVTFGTPGSFTLTATRTGGTESGTSNSFDVQAPPVAVNEGPAAGSAPGQPFHAFYSTSGSPQTFTLSAPGVLSNDNLGFPAATITSFGADSLGGSVTTYAAGSTVSPLPGTDRTTGSLSVAADGTVTFTPPDGFTGNYVFRYRLTNVRGTSDGQVTIAVGVRPAAVSDTYSPVLVGNVPINTATSTQFRVTTNDAGDGKKLAITGATGGTATLNADSTFTFRPTAGYNGAASFTYTITNGFGTTTPATVSMTVGTPIWFVNSSAAAGGDGRYDAPFNSLGSLAAINTGTGNNPADNDGIFLYTGTYTGTLSLRNGQRLIGQGATASLSSIAGVTWPADAGSEPAMNGTAPTLTASATNALTLNADNGSNLLRGFNFGSVGATGTALNGSNFGTLTVSEVGINTNGRAFSLTNGTISGSFPAVTSTGGNANVYLVNVGTSAPVTFGTGADVLSGASGAGPIYVDGGNGSFTFPGTMSATGGEVQIRNKNGGTVTVSGSINPVTPALGISINGNSAGSIVFSGPQVRISSATQRGVYLLNNDGATISFTGGGLAITTTTGNGFEAIGGGRVSVTGTGNTINSAGGVALSVVNDTIESGGLNFRSISANGGANGIVLNNTGSVGRLLVTGTGTAGSGGTIQNTTGHGVSLTSTSNPSFDRISLQSNGGSGIFGTGVVGFTLTNSTIATSGTGGGANASNIDFFADTAPGTENNLSGVVTITGNTLSAPAFHNVDIQNWSGTISDLNLSSNVLTNSSTQGGGIRVIAFGGAGNVAKITKATIANNQITGSMQSPGLQVQCGNASAGGPLGECGTVGSGTNVVSITSNQVRGTSAAARIGTEGLLALLNGRGQANFDVSSNDVRHTTGRAMAVSSFGQGTMTSTVNGNTIVANNTFASAGLEIGADSTANMASNGTYTATVTGNNVSQSDGVGIWAIARGSSQTLRVKLQNNTVAAPLSGVRPGLRIDSGSAVGNTTVCANVSGNTSAGSGGHQGIGIRKQGTNAAVNTFGVHGMAATSSPGVETYIAGLNPAGGGVLLLSATSGFTNCSLP
ncbi:MAG: Ig-like domain-containing protein [Gemmatimonadota bacterium]